MTIFISSLGFTIAGVNLITLAWTAFSRSITLIDVRPLHIEGVTFTTLDVLIVATCWLLIAALNATLSFTDLGRSIRAARGNPYLARIMGLEPDAIYLAVFAIGSLLCGAAGILDGARYAVQPNMGIRPVVFAFVVAFLGGTQSRPLVVGLAGLLIGLIESLSGLFVSPQWSSLVVFSVLFIYLVLRPLDLRAFRVRDTFRDARSGPRRVSITQGRAMDYWWDILNLVLIFSIFAISLNLLVGYTGQVSVAHAAFGAIGGYIAAYLSTKTGLDFWPALAAGAFGAGLAGVLMSLPALRLSPEYLVLLTIAVSSIVLAIVGAVGELGGAYGMIATQSRPI